jgi:hypothetical protein
LVPECLLWKPGVVLFIRKSHVLITSHQTEEKRWRDSGSERAREKEKERDGETEREREREREREKVYVCV